MNKKLISLVFFVALAALLSGCVVSLGGSGAKGADGGVWKSTDGGGAWQQKVAVPMIGGKTASIAGVDIGRMVLDDSDHNTVYLATEKNGIIYSYDKGDNWRQFKDLTNVKIRSIAVDPKDKCNLYALSGNKMYKSVDCGRSWINPYFHQDAQVVLTDIAVGNGNSNIVYISTSAGEVLKSVNGGRTWVAALKIAKAVFVDLVMDSRDEKIVYVASSKNGIYKTTNGGGKWDSLGEGLKAYFDGSDYRGLILDPATPNSLILISKFGMLRTRDGGTIWEVIYLLTASQKTAIYSAAVSPKDSKVIYYTTRTSLVKSTDGGQTWSSQKLPFSRVASDILINPENPAEVYLGTFNSKE